MANTGILELIGSARSVILEAEAMDGVGVFWGRAPRTSDLPYLILSVVPRRSARSFDPGRDHFRHATLQVRACAVTEGTEEAPVIAQRLLDAVYEQFTQTIDGETPKARLNRYLAPMGWQALPPIELAEVPPYLDHLGDLERWNLGSRYDMRFSRVL